jgi:hypothetical protein
VLQPSRGREMRNGSIELESGRWYWMLQPQWSGASLVFQHCRRVHDRMRSWTPKQDLTVKEVTDLALDPLERT